MKKKSIEKFIDEFKVNNSCIMLYDLNKLKENINNIIYLKEKYNVEFIFPVKAFPNIKVLKLFYNYGFGFDIANENEYNLIKEFINDKTLLSFNGVSAQTKKLNHNAIYNINTLEDISKDYYNGIRINAYIKTRNEFSRFGISIQKLHKLNVSNIKSISFHFYEENKTKKIKHIKKMLIKCENIFTHLNYINLGGNWNIVDVKNFEKIMVESRKFIDKKIKIIFEVGENWFDNCGYLITKVVGKNEIDNKKIIYINAIKDSVAKWSVLKPIHLNVRNEENDISIISGNSCYERDIFSVVRGNFDLSVNDKIVFIGLNGYSYAWCKEFNGSDKPEVIFYE